MVRELLQLWAAHSVSSLPFLFVCHLCSLFLFFPVAPKEAASIGWFGNYFLNVSHVTQMCNHGFKVLYVQQLREK